MNQVEQEVQYHTKMLVGNKLTEKMVEMFIKSMVKGSIVPKEDYMF